MVLGEKEGAIRLKDLAQEMKLDVDEALSFLKEVFPTGEGVEIYQKADEYWVEISSSAIQYMLPLSPGEWIHLHHMLEHETSSDPVVQSLKDKVTQNGPVKIVMDILHHLDFWDHGLSESQQNMIQGLETSIQEKELLRVETFEGKSVALYPCRILHLEGHLSLIAEDSHDHCLTIVPLNQIKVFETLPSQIGPKVTHFELEEFITAVRAMNESETRLILKIYDPQSINLFPNHHFLGKPCMVTNPNGDLIWAAYVEPCESLYEWLITLGKNVEILDPVRFKEEYLTYCEEKLRKIA